MKKESSDKQMKDILKPLETIQRVHISDAVYDGILNRLKERNVISMKWVRVAAIGLVLITSSALHVLQIESHSGEAITGLEVFIDIPNNQLYSYE